MNFNEACDIANAHLLSDFKDYLFEHIYPSFDFIEVIDEFELWERIDNQDFDQKDKLVAISTHCPTYYTGDNETHVNVKFYKLSDEGGEEDVRIVLKYDKNFKLFYIGFSDTTLLKTGYLEQISNKLLRSESLFNGQLKSEIKTKSNLRKKHSNNGVIEIQIPRI